MSIKSPQTLVSEALNEVKTITPEEAMKLNSENKCNLIDIRDGVELEKLGAIENSFHIPRGLLEFKLAPNSPNNPVLINNNTNILVYCAGGYRSALAAKTLLDLGFKNVYNLGGFQEWVECGGEIQPGL